MDNVIFVAIDADGAGRQVGRAVLDNNVQELHAISARINHGQDLVEDWAQSLGGQKISGGGDEMTIALPPEAIGHIEELRKDYEYAIQLTISVGVGKKLSEAGQALLAAKIRGKNQTVVFDDSVMQDIADAKDRVAQGTASSEEAKLAEAYLNPANPEQKGADMEKQDIKTDDHDDCPYCQEMGEQEDPDHCKYCHDMDSEQEDDDCPYCDQPHAEEDSEEPEQTAGPNTEEPTAESGEDYEALDMNPPELSMDPNNRPAIPPGPSRDENTALNDKLDADTKNSGPEFMAEDSQDGDVQGATSESLEDDDEHSKEAMIDILDQVASPDGEQTDKEVADEADATDITAGDGTEDGVSRPANFDQNSASDMGLSEEETDNEEPDLSEVLKEGLDSHADNIQKEKVIQLVSHALEGFKASKDILEKAREQAPEFYEANIAMLKAMIEMAKMLGIGQDGSEEIPDDSAPQEDDEWSDPFPAHPDHGGEMKPGHAAPAEGATDPKPQSLSADR